MMNSNPTLDKSTNYRSAFIHYYFDTNITMFPDWKVIQEVNWLSILNPLTANFVALHKYQVLVVSFFGFYLFFLYIF